MVVQPAVSAVLQLQIANRRSHQTMHSPLWAFSELLFAPRVHDCISSPGKAGA
jgi:hypothetical protein